jgi:hypothetical protein
MKFLPLLLLLLSGTLFAADSGLYYDAERDGEGILMLRNGDTVVTYMFTYGEDNCPDTDPVPSPSTVDDDDECDLNGQRWFFGVDEYEEISEEVAGTLYMGVGTNYPVGVQDKFDPFVMNVGQAVPAGEYILRRREDGWRMWIGPLSKGGVLDEDDVLFDKVFEFRTQLFEADESSAEPK